MTRHRRPLLNRRILPNRMISTFAYQTAPVLAKVLKQLSAFHGRLADGVTII